MEQSKVYFQASITPIDVSTALEKVLFWFMVLVLTQFEEPRRLKSRIEDEIASQIDLPADPFISTWNEHPETHFSIVLINLISRFRKRKEESNMKTFRMSPAEKVSKILFKIAPYFTYIVSNIVNNTYRLKFFHLKKRLYSFMFLWAEMLSKVLKHKINICHYVMYGVFKNPFCLLTFKK